MIILATLNLSSINAFDLVEANILSIGKRLRTKRHYNKRKYVKLITLESILTRHLALYDI